MLIGKFEFRTSTAIINEYCKLPGRMTICVRNFVSHFAGYYKKEKELIEKAADKVHKND